jgi:hypothetical protein
MHIVTEADTVIFTDPVGDTLTLLKNVRQKDVTALEELERKEALETLHELGYSVADVAKEADLASDEERAAARESAAGRGSSAKARRFRLGAIARGLTVAGKEHAGSAILQAYDEMDPASGAWVDAQVDGVWAPSTPGEAEKKGEAALLDMPDQQDAAK